MEHSSHSLKIKLLSWQLKAIVTMLICSYITFIKVPFEAGHVHEATMIPP